MSYHDKRNASPGVAGASEGVHAGNRNASEVKPNSKSNQELLAEFDEHRDRCEVNAQIAAWIFELQGRLWNAQSHLLNDDCRRHHATLASEIERLKLCISLAKKAREKP
jgi:hypothetical protein